jgi:ribosomal protein S8E
LTNISNLGVLQMTQAIETTNVSAQAAAAIGAAVKPKREVSPQAQAALEKHRQRATLGMAILDVLEAGESGDLAKLNVLAQAHIVAQAEAKAAADAEKAANAVPRGAHLAQYREKANAAISLQEYLASTGVNVEELLEKARAATPAA